MLAVFEVLLRLDWPLVQLVPLMLVTGIVSGPAAGELLAGSTAADSSIEGLTFSRLVTVLKYCQLRLYMPPSCVCAPYDRDATCPSTVPDFCHLPTFLSYICTSWPGCNGGRLCIVIGHCLYLCPIYELVKPLTLIPNILLSSGLITFTVSRSPRNVNCVTSLFNLGLALSALFSTSCRASSCFFSFYPTQ